MNTHSWWTFCIATFFICGSPGPNMLMVMSSSIRYGLRLTFFTMAGSFTAAVCAVAASMAGIGALLKAEPMIFDALRFIGAAYLMYMGIQAWRATTTVSSDTAPVILSTSPGKNFRKGFLVCISNPKALLFAAAFFPQFINPDAPELPQFMLLLATFSVIEFGWYMVYALGGNSLTTYMKQHSVRKAFNRLTGGLFATFGVFLLFSKLSS